jgi:hypothetical protein
VNWRRWLGFDPAGSASIPLASPADRSGGVVKVFQLRGGGEIRVDEEQLRRSVDAANLHVREYGLPQGMVPRILVHHDRTSGQLMRQLMGYSPRESEGKPLAGKEKTLHHGLHLDDYQPRSHEHGVQRITYERAYPPLPEQQSEDMWVLQRPTTGWVDYRNRSPLHEGYWTLPPMRDALADLIEHLHMVHAKLAEQDLVAVEVSVQHEPTPSREDGAGQGWNFAVHTVAVPQAVREAEQKRFDAKQAERKSEQAKRTPPDGS